MIFEILIAALVGSVAGGAGAVFFVAKKRKEQSEKEGTSKGEVLYVNILITEKGEAVKGVVEEK
jgi:flagellar basal body-associated protein FliL